jgi:hypothetical protein
MDVAAYEGKGGRYIAARHFDRSSRPGEYRKLRMVRQEKPVINITNYSPATRLSTFPQTLSLEASRHPGVEV